MQAADEMQWGDWGGVKTVPCDVCREATLWLVQALDAQRQKGSGLAKPCKTGVPAGGHLPLPKTQQWPAAQAA